MEKASKRVYTQIRKVAEEFYLKYYIWLIRFKGGKMCFNISVAIKALLFTSEFHFGIPCAVFFLLFMFD